MNYKTNFKAICVETLTSKERIKDDGVKHYVVVDEVEVVAWSDSHRTAAAPSHTSIGLMQRLMDEDEC